MYLCTLLILKVSSKTVRKWITSELPRKAYSYIYVLQDKKFE